MYKDLNDVAKRVASINSYSVNGNYKKTNVRKNNPIALAMIKKNNLV